ncbi:hypothetical protein [Amycolatopsis sp. CA-230715]|uniref:hypothetical protein n=1 Tax=Amycolatopsis sp. CA-230715 TaxID=2745196 RepID=UPI001C02B953|nr:hypothetical protein [Amycolatopsis sp. CA-230715]QWF82093.1 hypothetical protein HUW46_05530 [Amycolatopsis sp. CA-230715]
MGRTERPKAARAALGLLTVSLLGSLTLVSTAGVASADFKQKTGVEVKPGQPYGGKDRSADWLGSYEVGGKQVFCVEFEYKAPDTDEKYQPGDELKTKWGEPLSPGVAADISYLLLRYGDTKSNDEAAALAHLLHSWTSPHRDGQDDLNPKNSFRTIAYDEKRHFDQLGGVSPAAKDLVGKLRKEAETNRGPWTTSVTPPKEEQTIGTSGDWKLGVLNAAKKGVAKVPVKLKLTDATLEDGKSTGTATTGADGTASVKVRPTGEHPKVETELSGPADRPYVQAPIEVDTQRVVSTGGEKKLTANGTAAARTKPGIVAVTKLDSKSGKGIPGAVLRLTAKDRTAPALGQDGKPLTGPDGKPAVLTTEGDTGKATVPNLKTPQEICVVEVSPPNGYGEAFDSANPPSACGEVKPGETLALEIKNVPNAVPRAIPAGAKPAAMITGAVTTGPSTGGVLSLAGIAVLGSALVGFVARRRFTR